MGPDSRPTEASLLCSQDVKPSQRRVSSLMPPLSSLSPPPPRCRSVAKLCQSSTRSQRLSLARLLLRTRRRKYSIPLDPSAPTLTTAADASRESKTRPKPRNEERECCHHH